MVVLVIQLFLLIPYPPSRFINSNKVITNDDINSLLVNQKVSISQKELDKLLEIKGVSFELPLSDQTYPAYYSLIGRPKTRGRRVGVYIFTHIKSGSKYVGASNSLSRRLEQYFNPNPKFNKYGLLLPLLKK
jgi:GIY-YIG catalytic domain